MVRFPLLPTLASCLLALTAQAQAPAKAKPAPAKTAAVQPFTPAAIPDNHDHEPVPAHSTTLEVKEVAPVPATPAAMPSAPAAPAKPSPKPAKQ